ncbi:MAG TPA: TonB-dependent receptor plug domain-containing protein [Gemmatimonadaceae bacterium]
MTRRHRGLGIGSLLFLCIPAAPAAAQSAMTITGHVSAASMPLKGANVRIESLDLVAVTNNDGRYSFIVPSTRVRGQTVKLSVEYPRYKTQTVDIDLTGGSVVRDFELTDASPSKTPSVVPSEKPSPGPPPATTAPTPRQTQVEPTMPATSRVSSVRRVARATIPVQVVDSSAFMDVAGPTDLAGALQGRLSGADIQSSSAPGGTSSIVVRGPRSIVGVTQPLVVLDGIVIDNSNLTSTQQSAGLGGFDYGTLLADINPEDVASVQLLTGPAAALRYGGRAANGALVVTTRSARGLNGFEAAASQQITISSALRLPAYQDFFGQGRDGKFAFFDGKGGGINDGTDDSWGPALDGTPVLQASHLEAGRPEVRGFFAHPGSVDSYYRRGRTVATSISLLGGNDFGQVRGAISSRNTNGVVPSTSVTYRSAVATASAQPNARVNLSGTAQYFSDAGQDRPGSGFDESNAVAGFSHMPRSVDVAAYQTFLRDVTGKQLSWNYNGRNNPWFSALENKNHDDRTRYVAGGTATFALSDWLTGTARGGLDHSSDARSFSVASGWMGGFPYYAGRGDFSTGGFQNDDITRSASNAEVLFRAAPPSGSAIAVALSAGAGLRSNDLQMIVRGADRLVDTTTPAPVSWSANGNANYLFGGFEASVRDAASLTVGARQEASSVAGSASNSQLYPAVVATLDLARLDTGSHGPIESFVVHAGWSRTGNDATPAVLQRLGFSAVIPAVSVSAVATPELTTGWQAGATMRMMNRRLSLDLTAYGDRSENLVIPNGTTFLRTASMTNSGVEAGASIVPYRAPDGSEWAFGATFAKNTNTVESLAADVTRLALAPAFGGVSVEARTGSSLGVLVGTGYLRDPSGVLQLRNGRPLPDTITGPRILGETMPSWIGGLSSSFRSHGIELSALLDTHHGGKVFSASNRAGAVTGVLAETAVRPDSGLLISGIDVATGALNTVHVSTENYYRALGAIAERWIYDASLVKLREVRASYLLPLDFISALRAQSGRISLIGRNLALWTNAPNIDPETVLSTSNFRGAEMGQLPSVKSLGVQVTLVP